MLVKGFSLGRVKGLRVRKVEGFRALVKFGFQLEGYTYTTTLLEGIKRSCRLRRC